MSVQQVDRDAWSVLFGVVTNSLAGRRAEVEFPSPDLDPQTKAEWAPLVGFSYDVPDDVIELMLERADHLIFEPHEVYLDSDIGGLIAVEVVDAGGARHALCTDTGPVGSPLPDTDSDPARPARP